MAAGLRGPMGLGLSRPEKAGRVCPWANVREARDMQSDSCAALAALSHPERGPHRGPATEFAQGHTRPALRSGTLSPSPVQPRVDPTRRGQLLVGSLLGDPPVLEHDDLAGAADRREAVGDDDRGAAVEQALEALLDRLLGADV